MGGPRVTPKTEKLIVDMWITLSEEGREPTSYQVLTAAESYIKRYDRRDIFLPKIRKVQNIIRDAKKQSEGFPPEENILQKPWSMATLNEYPLPTESLKAVASVWRYALITGENFTIRQAKWVSRLYDFQDDVLKLWLISYEYSKKEEAFLLSNHPFDTFNDDLRLVFSTYEVLSIWKTIYEDNPIPDPFSTKIPYADDGGVMHEVLHPVDYYNALYSGTITNDRDKELHYLIAKLPSFDSLKLISNELRIVYLIWISRIKQLPEWQSITAEEAADVVLKLREWAVEVQNKKFELLEKGEGIEAAIFVDNKVTIEPGVPTPDNILELLRKYAGKEAKQ